MSWCWCCKSEDESIKPWKDNTRGVIKIVERIRYLGKRCIKNRQLNREDWHDIRDIAEYFKRLDGSIHDLKFKAVEFLAPSRTLLKQRNCEINHYRKHLEEKLNTFGNEIKTMKEKYSSKDQPCSSRSDDNEIFQNIRKSQLIATEMFSKQTSLLGDLKKLLLKFDQNIKTVEDQIDNLRMEAKNDQDDNNILSEYEGTEEIHIGTNDGAVQYFARNSRRHSEELDIFQGSQNLSSTETFTLINKENVEQGWSILRDCVECLWSNYRTSTEYRGHVRNSTRSEFNEDEGDDEPNRRRVQNRKAERSKSKFKKESIDEENSFEDCVRTQTVNVTKQNKTKRLFSGKKKSKPEAQKRGSKGAVKIKRKKINKLR